MAKSKIFENKRHLVYKTRGIYGAFSFLWEKEFNKSSDYDYDDLAKSCRDDLQEDYYYCVYRKVRPYEARRRVNKAYKKTFKSTFGRLIINPGDCSVVDLAKCISASEKIIGFSRKSKFFLGKIEGVEEVSLWDLYASYLHNLEVLVIDVASFWVCHPLRFSFFTGMIKKFAHENDWKSFSKRARSREFLVKLLNRDCKQRYNYFQCELSLRKFLGGRTRISSSCHEDEFGWLEFTKYARGVPNKEKYLNSVFKKAM